ncbi:hypothetical protein BCR35DRAFT_209560 [Leucosporidium creatinivorum]|uniref:Fungal lipase-type domain-containing protein n=1 Tax=Leucosporidium creatinivorum TaxID=106004 RepID=A0A1Y2DEI2_9BASI|nr:hypothetical protein BCR35DRAFT_209560 [Leucosporidium creatinivorum]
MMIAFQRKIIYLPSVPPGSRNESLAEGERTPPLDGLLSGMDWKEVTISSTAPSRWLRRPVALKGIELEWREQGAPRGTRVDEQERLKEKHTVILYLQGNAGTPLLRLPLFRRLLQPSPTSSPPSPSSRSFNTLPSSTSNPPPLPSRLTLLAVAPRSFWLSTRSAPTQSTILADYRSTLKHLSTAYPDAQIILYGHSLGGAATLLLLSEGASKLRALEKVVGAIIENPLPSIPYMVRALYPQRWLPYHWLGPAVCDRSFLLIRRSRVKKGMGSKGCGRIGRGSRKGGRERRRADG